MKKYFAIFLMIFLIITLIPLIALGKTDPIPKENNNDSTTTEPENNSQNIQEYSSNTYSDFKVLISETNEVKTMTEEEYIIGVVSAEIPADYNVEAIKAQAVACYTYAYLARAQERLSPSADLNGADISDNPNNHQGYIDSQQAAEKWGENAEIYSKKIREAVEEVCGNVIFYNGNPIIAAYHRISTGNTESAKVVWNEEVPYLQSVASPGDILSPDYINIVRIPVDKFKTSLAELNVVNFTDNPSEWISDIICSDAKTVTSIKICGAELSGNQLRSALGLRSAAFDVVYSGDDTFEFTVYGYGHCAGLSQYGADYMARQGDDWKKIINHYYADVEIIDTRNQSDEAATVATSTTGQE